MSDKKKILFFSPYGFWLIHNQLDAVVATALEIRGCEVLVIGCDGIYRDCSITRNNSNQELICKNCSQAGRNFFVDTFQLPYIQLRNFIENEDYTIAENWANTISPENYKNAVYQNLAIGRWVLSTISTHFRISASGLSSSHVSSTYKKYLIDGLVTYNALVRLCNYYQPTNIFIFNARFAPYRIAFEVARHLKIDLITHERGFIDDSFTLFDNYPTWNPQPLLNSVNTWQNIPLNNEELLQTKNFFVSREHGLNFNWPAFYDFQTKTVDIHRQLRIPANAKILAVFTSSEDELADIEDKTKVTEQFEIIDNLIEIFKNRQEYLIIRHHPFIGGIKETPIEIDSLSKAYKQVFSASSNVRFVMPSEQLTSYALLWHTDAAISIFSTVAIEAMARGIPTAVLATSAYEKASQYIIKETNREYLNNLIDTLFADTAKSTVDHLKRVYRFTHAYFFKFSHKFRSFGIKDFHSHDLRFETFGDLQPGNDPTLDKVCDRIMFGTPLANLPDNDSTRIPEQEAAFYQQELQTINKHKNLVRQESLEHQNNLLSDKLSVGIIHLNYTVNSVDKTQLSSDYLQNSRYKNIIIHQLNECQLEEYENIVDSILTLIENLTVDYILLSNNYTQYDESFISSSIDIFTNQDSQNIDGVFTGGYISTIENRIEDGIFISGVFNKQGKLIQRQPNIPYLQAVTLIPLLSFPLTILLFGIFKKDVFKEILLNIKQISKHQASQYLFEYIFNNPNLIKIGFPKLVIRQELEIFQALKLRDSQLLIQEAFNLREINFILCPNWELSEEDLLQDFKSILKSIITHPDKNRIALLINIDTVTEDDANIILSSAVMELLMEENLEIDDDLQISFLNIVNEIQTELQWQALHSLTQGRILCHDDHRTIINIPQLAAIDIYDSSIISQKRAVQTQNKTWNFQ